MARALSLVQACSKYQHRYTGEHIPEWAVLTAPVRFKGVSHFYAPTYATDKEWYDNTDFPGEGDVSSKATHCESHNYTFPFGKWLAEPYQLNRTPIPSPGFEPQLVEEHANVR